MSSIKFLIEIYSHNAKVLIIFEIRKIFREKINFNIKKQIKEIYDIKQKKEVQGYSLNFQLSIIFYLIQHFEGCLDGCFRLVGIESTSADYLAVKQFPSDNRLNESICTTTWWYGNSII